MLPEDLLKFGLIPEFVGRLPVIGAVSNLDKEALVRILVEPKNALVKQYRRVFELDNVELEFTEDALEAVAEQALLRGTGARGLRAILEEVLLEVMYDLPSRTDIGKCVIDRSVVLDRVNPTLVPKTEAGEKESPAPPGRVLTRIAGAARGPSRRLMRLPGASDGGSVQPMGKIVKWRADWCRASAVGSPPSRPTGRTSRSTCWPPTRPRRAQPPRPAAPRWVSCCTVRQRRRKKRSRSALLSAGTSAALTRAARKGRPAVEQAAELWARRPMLAPLRGPGGRSARPYVERAAESARPYLDRATDVAKEQSEHAEKVAERTRKRAEKAASGPQARRAGPQAGRGATAERGPQADQADPQAGRGQGRAGPQAEQSGPQAGGRGGRAGPQAGQGGRKQAKVVRKQAAGTAAKARSQAQVAGKRAQVAGEQARRQVQVAAGQARPYVERATESGPAVRGAGDRDGPALRRAGRRRRPGRTSSGPPTRPGPTSSRPRTQATETARDQLSRAGRTRSGAWSGRRSGDVDGRTRHLATVRIIAPRSEPGRHGPAWPERRAASPRGEA